MTSLDPSAQFPAALPETSGSALVNSPRLRFAAICWIVIALAAYVIDLLRQTHDGLSDGASRAFGDDFVNYWSGAFLAFHGRAAEVYDLPAFHAFEQSITGANIGFYHYGYPPLLPILTVPLALIPYVPALGVWLVGTWYGFYRALRLAGNESVLLISLAIPALFVNAVGGQN